MHPADACTRCEGTFGDRFPSSVLAPSPTSTLTLRLSDSAAKHTVPSFPFAYDHPAHAPLRGWGGSGVRSAPAVLYGLYCTVVRRGLRSPSFPVFALFRWRPSTGCIYLRYSLIIIWRPFTGLSRVRVRSVPGRTEGSAVLPYGIMKSCNLPVGGARPTLVLRSVRMHARTSDGTQAAGLAKAFAAHHHHQLPRPGARA